jgi:hypothetical protein
MELACGFQLPSPEMRLSTLRKPGRVHRGSACERRQSVAPARSGKHDLATSGALQPRNTGGSMRRQSLSPDITTPGGQTA